jgi:hypothetical protein
VRRPALIALLAAGLLLAGCGSDDSGSGGAINRKPPRDPQCGRTEETQRCEFEIDLYCQYAAVSRAQLESCEDRVTWGEIKRLDTNAARFARLELDKCLADAGPFCHASAAEPDYGDYGY